MFLGAIASVVLLLVPVPKVPRPSEAELLAVFGKTPVSAEVRDLVKALGVNPTVQYNCWSTEVVRASNTGFYLMWNAQGLDLSVGESGIGHAWLYNQGADGHDRYVGLLPKGLTFDDGPEAVARKLGLPTNSSEPLVRRHKGQEPFEWTTIDYAGGYSIDFRRLLKGGPARIHMIGLHPELPKK